MLNMLKTLFVMEIKAQWRQKMITLLPLFLFSLWVGLFLFLFEKSTLLTSLFKMQCFWLFLIFTLLFTLHRQFESDLQTGLLDLIRYQNWPIEYYILVKLVSNWTFVCLPLLLVALAAGYVLSPASNVTLATLFIAGTFAAHTLLSFGSLLTLQNVHKSILLPFLLFPFCVPIVILGLSGIEALFYGQSVLSCVLLLVSFLLVLIPLHCLLGGAFLKHLNG